MFEEYTEDYFLEQARKMGQALEVDTRQGSVYMDAASGHCIRVAKFYNDLKMAFDMLFIDTCAGAVLDEKAKERNLTRKQATQSYYTVEFVGVAAEKMIGNRFFVQRKYFVLQKLTDGYFLVSEEIGSGTNNIVPGQAVVPVRNTENLVSATLGAIYKDGTNMESDEELRERLRELMSNAPENGNKQQYKSWCEEFEGVGRAIPYPLRQGENTIDVVIISSDGDAPTKALIEALQNHIDPGSEGLGEGEAPCGCHFYAIGAENMVINISFNVEYAGGVNPTLATKQVIKDLQDYLKLIALTSNDSETMIIRYVKITSILANSSGIVDFSNLLINGSSVNIIVGENKVAVLGEVEINGSVL